MYEPVDLGFGFCRLVVAEPRELWERDDPAKWSWVRVATKYPTLTERYFSERGIQVEMVRLDGSIELAPLVGPRRAHRGPRPVGRDPARQRPRRGRADHDLHRAAHRQPRVAQDRARARERPDRGDAPGSRARAVREAAAMIRRLDTRRVGRRRAWCARWTGRPPSVDPAIHQQRRRRSSPPCARKGDAALRRADRALRPRVASRRTSCG